MACLILKQHASSILPHLKGDKKICEKIFASIPQSVEPMDIVQWIRHFFPLSSEAFPEIVPTIIDWVVTKTISYEHSDDWPLIGIGFAREMLNIFETTHYTFE